MLSSAGPKDSFEAEVPKAEVVNALIDIPHIPPPFPPPEEDIKRQPTCRFISISYPERLLRLTG